MNINLEKYSYQLPKEKIAKFPEKKRSDSKLLVYKNGEITHTKFNNILDFIASDSLLVFNNTRVIQARLVFKKETGARIEIFCLEEITTDKNISKWKCLVGNKKKWKAGELTKVGNYKNEKIVLKSRITSSNRKETIIEFEWNKDITFFELLNIFGETPLPPYIKRDVVPEDVNTYQTVYAQHSGAVAAPTAGLHFTQEIIDSLDKNKIKKDFVTLHVSAGTFQPIKEKNVIDHPMHNEQIIFTKQNIQNLIEFKNKIICVGTTSLRAIESLYWFGVMLKNDSNSKFQIEKLYPYEKLNSNLPSLKESLIEVLEYMSKNKIEILTGNTSIFIFPSYKFKICDILISNYHQPQSTLILLVAAFIGDDWKKVYDEALSKDYRFLSYGDSSILFS